MKRTNYPEFHEVEWQDALHVFETVPDLYLILSPELNILTASNAYLKALSISREVLVNTGIDEVFSKYDISDKQVLQEIMDCLAVVVERGELQSLPVQKFNSLKRSGATYAAEGYWQVSNTPIKDESNNILYIIHKVSDVTEIIQKELKLQAVLSEDEKKLAASAELLRKAEEAGNMGSYQVSLLTGEISFSDGMYRLMELEPGTFPLTVEFLTSMSHPEDAELINQIILRAIAEKQPFNYVRRIYLSNGEMKYIQSNGRVILNESGDPGCIMGVSQDITEKKMSDEALDRTHEALEKSKDLLQSMFDTSLIGMSLLHPIRDSNGEIEDFTIMLVSKELEKETGRTDLAGKRYSIEYPGIRKTGLWEMMIKVMDTGTSEHMEYFYPYEGFNKWYSCTFVKMDDGIVASNYDISPIRNAEAKIREMEEAQKLEVFKATISTQEEERNRIAEDLRNGIGQLLYAVKMNLRQVEADLANTDPAAFVKAKEQTDKILAEAIKEIRRLSHQMTPAILSDFGLEDTVRDLCRQFAHVLNIKSSFVGLNTRFDRYIEVSIYRMVQELILNIVNHAKASKATVELEVSNNQLRITVSDNGTGFFPEEVKGKGIGLATLYNKVRLLNGQLVIENDRGTKVRISLPVNLNAN
jgi:signal transduction histidine kinase/PAS domain-containing protein